MSSYQKTTKHPETGDAENAEWLDDYFGQHNYGVRFPSDGKVFRADEYEWQENPQTMCFEGTHKLGYNNPVTVDITPKGSRWDHPMHEVDRNEDGKETVTTKHEDGRQDVQVKVTRLNIENRTPEDDIAEEKIIDTMSKKIVRVVVIHKPTNEFASFESPLPQVRIRAEQVVKKHMGWKEGETFYTRTNGQYAIVEFDADQVRVTSL